MADPPRPFRAGEPDQPEGPRRRGELIPVSELGRFVEEPAELTIYHKNLKRLNYVVAETVGRSPVEAVFDWWDIKKAKPLPAGYSVDLSGEGEWEITVDVFRDLGLAFGAAVLMNCVLLIAHTESPGMPLIIMVAIPLTVMGIMPGFWFLNIFCTEPVAGYDAPILFTATGMTGIIALAGIVVIEDSIPAAPWACVRGTKKPGHA